MARPSGNSRCARVRLRNAPSMSAGAPVITVASICVTPVENMIRKDLAIDSSVVLAEL